MRSSRSNRYAAIRPTRNAASRIRAGTSRPAWGSSCTGLRAIPAAVQTPLFPSTDINKINMIRITSQARLMMSSTHSAHALHPGAPRQPHVRTLWSGNARRRAQTPRCADRTDRRGVGLRCSARRRTEVRHVISRVVVCRAGRRRGGALMRHRCEIATRPARPRRRIMALTWCLSLVAGGAALAVPSTAAASPPCLSSHAAVVPKMLGFALPPNGSMPALWHGKPRVVPPRRLDHRPHRHSLRNAATVLAREADRLVRLGRARTRQTRSCRPITS